jgi:LIVCS family branched-chain amino acid:cation transporter
MTKRIVFTSGLALFAMFFGAGNIIYPLALGAEAGDHIGFVIIAFLISGIGLPFLGLFAASFFQGDYWKFFSRLGKIPAFLLITFLILVIGPLFGAPRTEAVAYHTLRPFLPIYFANTYVFSAFYCAILFLLTYRQSKIVDIIGRILSPIKLTLFIVLIIAGLMGPHVIMENKNSVMSSIKTGLLDGYSTMDLIAAFFFCSIVSRHILLKAKSHGITDNKSIIKIFLLSCLVGGILLSIIYIGFMLIALCHANELQNIDTAQMIATISHVVLGNFGALFVGICVGFACLVTAIALTEVTTEFLYLKIAQQKISRTACLGFTVSAIFAMSILGFSGIMRLALPILEVLYPALILYSMFIIGSKLFSARKLPPQSSLETSTL